MDFRNLCQHIDMDSIRAKLPSMPDFSAAMPQLKLPKSLPKLRSRRIFRSSREDVNRSSSKKHQTAPPTAPPIPPSDFINHSPRRISTIASLMNENDTPHRGTYRSARSIEDDYPSPRQFHNSQTSRPISPVRIPADSGADEQASAPPKSFTERLQKSYKDISEFRLKHIFAKKTVVRKDTIQVDHYVERYDEDRAREQREQEKRDRQIADNYRFNFKVSRQNTGHTDSISSNESPVAAAAKQEGAAKAKSVSALSGDESGMDITPPKRKPGIASTRFAKVRNPPLRQSMSEESIELGPEQPNEEPVSKDKHTPPEVKPSAESDSKGMKAFNKLRNLGKRNENDSAEPNADKKRKAPLTPQQSEDQETPATPNDNPLSTIKQNIKRFHKSLKRQQASAEESEEEAAAEAADKKPVSKTEKLAARLRKLKSFDSSADNLDNAKESPKKTDEHKSPIHAVITNKLQTWKKSFKRRPNESEVTNTGDETSPEKEKRSDNLIKRLKHMRSRKAASSTDDLDAEDDEEGSPNKAKNTKEARKPANFEERFVQARQRTIKKVNEKMQQMKFFHKSQEQVDKEDSSKQTENKNQSDDEDYDDEHTAHAVHKKNRPPAIARRSYPNDSPCHDEQEDIEEIHNSPQEYALQKTRTIWTTKNLLSDSLDSETDSELPRVLIHQDNSDIFESTLIIAVTRPATQSPPTTKIREIMPGKRTPSPGSRSADWIPNTEVISSFLEITPPSKRRFSSDAILPTVPARGHRRKLSMDSNSDSDSWMPEHYELNKQSSESRAGSLLALNSIDEKEEPWKVHTMYRDEKLYKSKSIDIFEKNAKQGGVSAAFEDFDDALKGEPIVKITQRNVDSFEKDSSEELDAADDDNSSRVTKILVASIREEREEEMAALEEPNKTVPIAPVRQTPNAADNKTVKNETTIYDDVEDDDDYDDANDDEDRPPSAAPSPPPSMSPPPPPLPERKPSIRMPKPKVDSPPLPSTRPPLPTSRPPPPPPAKPVAPPPRVPERTPSMSRIAKPLVKTSSLRLAYNEQVNPSDVGKVNKLISRFEQPAPKVMQRPRIVARRTLHDDDNSEEDYTDDDDEEEDDENESTNDDDDDGMLPAKAKAKAKFERDTTPTPTNTPRMSSVDSDDSVRCVINNNNAPTSLITTKPHVTANESNQTVTNRKDIENNVTTMQMLEINKATMELTKMSLNVDNNSNASFSRPSSEYGSPLSSLIGSTETTPIADRRTQEIRGAAERSRRSMTRDDDRFLSFDSDEENSYYSISSSGSSRYVVEI